MSLSENPHFNPISSSTINEDLLIREIIYTHDPDDRHLNSEMLLNFLESTFCHTTDNVIDAKFDAVCTNDIDFIGSEEPISLIIYKISSEILIQCFEDKNLHTKTLFLLEKLSRYRWDAKVVLALSSFEHNFGLFRLIFQQQSDNALAVSLATVKGLPGPITNNMLKLKVKALNMLVNTMIKLTKFIISFEGFSWQLELVDHKAMDITKSKIYFATYWIFRSILVCSSEVEDLRNLIVEQVYSDKTVIAACGLHSLGTKLNSLCQELGEYVDKCQQQIETRLYDKLLNVFKENQVDNQHALRTLFAYQNRFPFMNSSSGDKCGIEELKNKVIILLISKPELYPIDKIFLLLHQTSDHPNHIKIRSNYAILWIPIISSSHEWSVADKTTFEFFSSFLPWFSVRTPWSLNSIVIKHIKQEWGYKDDPIMVVLDDNGMVTNSNANDMVWIWGPKAYPFSTSREKELWEQANWTIGLIINGINTLSSEWVEGGKNICIFGSDNLDWIREFNSIMKKIKSVGIQFEVLYVGYNNPSENLKTIIDTIDQENLCHSLALNKVHLFWSRLETIKRSINGQDSTARFDKIASEVAELLEFDNNWALIGKGSSIDVIKLDQEKVKGCVGFLQLWSKNVAQMGLVGAIRTAFEATYGDEKCHHDEMVPYEEGLIEKTMICGSCNRHVEKFVLYKCEE